MSRIEPLFRVIAGPCSRRFNFGASRWRQISPLRRLAARSVVKIGLVIFAPMPTCLNQRRVAAEPESFTGKSIKAITICRFGRPSGRGGLALLRLQWSSSANLVDFHTRNRMRPIDCTRNQTMFRPFARTAALANTAKREDYPWQRWTHTQKST